jgi:hypothetical protein
MARALAGLGGEGEALGLERLLTGLKGTSVELRGVSGTFAGRVVEVLAAERSDLTDCVRRAPAAACTPEAQPVLVLMTKAGELRRFRLRDVESVRPTDAGMAARLGASLDALSDGSAKLLKEVRVMVTGGGSVSLGYVSETPVWRASYRLVLADARGDSAVLQGWALVHNDTDEAWKRVQVELVNGSPDSFLFSARCDPGSASGLRFRFRLRLRAILAEARGQNDAGLRFIAPAGRPEPQRRASEVLRVRSLEHDDPARPFR